MKKIVFLAFLLVCHTAFGQVIKGTLYNADNNQPIEFVNIGIVGKNVGTVADLQGRFSLLVDAAYDDETILFTSIGYKPLSISVADLRKNSDNKLFLKEKAYELAEVIIRPKKVKQKTLGVTTKQKNIEAGFKDNKLGYECGILMKVKKTAFIKWVNINISSCSYDTLFYRLNIYKVNGKLNFENILTKPIYIKRPKESVRDEISIDLQSENILVKGDFLITLEHVKDLGEGFLHFCAGLTHKTYYRKTSQGVWQTAPVGISISVIADVEK